MTATASPWTTDSVMTITQWDPLRCTVGGAQRGGHRYPIDALVDEDPDEQEYIGELGHIRNCSREDGLRHPPRLIHPSVPIPWIGKGRDRERDTHLLLSKPIHRAEFIVYRLMGYLAIAGSYVIALSLVVGLIASLLGQGSNHSTLGRLPKLGIGFATTLVLAAYGSIFNAMG